MLRPLWAIFTVSALLSGGCAGETSSDGCPKTEAAAGSACGDEGLTCTYPGTMCDPGAKLWCEDGKWKAEFGSTGCDPFPPPPPTKPPADPPKDPPKEPPPVTTACPPDIPQPGAACAGSGKCSYTEFVSGCGFSPVEAMCSGGYWKTNPYRYCAAGTSLCDPFGTWVIEVVTSDPVSCFPGPPTGMTVSLLPNGNVHSDWDLSTSVDGCSLAFDYYYAYDDYETGSESKQLKLAVSGDAATGEYSYFGDGFSTGSCSATLKATRQK